jgi:hypothetical protein
VNLLGDNIDTMKNNIETSIDARKEVGLGRAVAQRLDDDFPPRRPGFAPGQIMWDLWWTKLHWGRFSPSTSAFPASHHSNKFSILIITQGRYYRPIGGRRGVCIQLHSPPPPLFELKKSKSRRRVEKCIKTFFYIL